MQRAFNMLHNMRFLPSGDPYNPSISIPDFRICQRNPDTAAFFYDEASEVRPWSLAVCQQFHEFSAVRNHTQAPEYVGGQILAYMVLTNAGMAQTRVLELLGQLRY